VFADNVQFTRRFIDAFNARNIEAIVACCAPDIELHSTFAAVGGATYSGHDGVRRWQEDLADAWGEEIRVEPEAYFDLGEQTLAFLHGARAWTAQRSGGRDIES
jgi:ketosteroid isomerase-like protein